MNERQHELKLLALQKEQAKQIRRLIKQTSDQIGMRVSILQGSSKIDKKKFAYQLQRNKELQKQLTILTAEMGAGIEQTVTTGVSNAWSLSNSKNDLLVKEYVSGLPVSGSVISSMTNLNTDALSAFAARRGADGLQLSDRVWNLQKASRQTIEDYLGTGITQGKSAAKISQDIRSSLNNPDSLFRRVRTADGKLVLSKAAKAYHPGRGVYRSAYKNAMRLARTETNAAFRIADYTRRKQLPFVIGVMVHLSNAHPEVDICDHNQGRYPKTFVFSGWHPHCICYSTAILMPKDEFMKYLRTGKVRSKGIVRNIPPSAARFVLANKKKFKKSDWYKANFTEAGKAKQSVIGSQPLVETAPVKKKINFLGPDVENSPELFRILKSEEMRKTGNTHADAWLESVAEHQGMTGLPRKVSAAEYSRAKGAEIYRGVFDHKYVKQFKDGDYFGGTGIHGSGSYFSNQRRTAFAYAGADDENIMAMKISKDAKIMSDYDLRQKMYKWMDEMDSKFGYFNIKKYVEAGKITSEEANIWMRYSSMGGDPGRFAAMIGVDAIQVTHNSGEIFYVIINRAKLITK